MRKKSSGESFAQPNHADTFFIPQEVVDQFTCSYGTQSTKVENVSFVDLYIYCMIPCFEIREIYMGKLVHIMHISKKGICTE